MFGCIFQGVPVIFHSQTLYVFDSQYVELTFYEAEFLGLYHWTDLRKTPTPPPVPYLNPITTALLTSHPPPGLPSKASHAYRWDTVDSPGPGVMASPGPE